MPEINANIVVEPYNIVVSTTENPITITPEAFQLNVITGGTANPGAPVGALQYNAGGIFGAVPNANFVSGNLSLGNVANVKILGGNNTYFLQTDGLGNLSWAVASGNVTGNGVPGGSNTQIQYNAGGGAFGGSAGFTFDNISNRVDMPGELVVAGDANVNGNLDVIGNLTATNSDLGNLATANFITVSSNIDANVGDFDTLRTNATAIYLGILAGNSNPSLSGIGIGAGAAAVNQGIRTIAIGYDAGGTNQSNRAIAIGSNAGFTGQGLSAVAIGENAGYNSQANNTIVINATGSNLDATTANTFIVKPIRNANTSNVLYYDQSTGEIVYDAASSGTIIENGTSNVSIPVANGNVRVSVAGNGNIFVVAPTGANVNGYFTVTGNSNISGTLGIAGNANAGNLGTTSVLASANITAPQLISNVATGTAPLVVTSTTLVPNLNVANANYANTAGSTTTAGTVTTNAQPNITSVGNLTDLRVNNLKLHLGTNSGVTNQSNYAIAFGVDAGNTNQGLNAIAIGYGAGNVNQSNNAVAIGASAGNNSIGLNAIAIGPLAGLGLSTSLANYSIAIGSGAAGNNGGGENSIFIGRSAGSTAGSGNRRIAIGYSAGAQGTANTLATAIGFEAGLLNQGLEAIALGARAGYNAQSNSTVAIGTYAGYENQGIYSVAIGYGAQQTNAGSYCVSLGVGAGANAQANNTIILNASGANLNQTTANTFTVKPIRNARNDQTLVYDTTTGEISYTNYLKTVSTTVGALTAANTVGAGGRAFVTDANTTTFNAVVGGGGANSVPVFSDGTNWKVG